MKRFVSCLLLLAGSLAPALLEAQVPQLVNYQGRIAVAGENFTGTGQFRFALVDGAGKETYWTNDGSGVDDNSEPNNPVQLTVSKGLYSVMLGNTALPNMTALPSTVFSSNSEIYLRVWFDDGSRGSELLVPNQRIAAVGYAMMAGNVPNGSITSAKIASGAVGSTQLATGAAAANLSASNLSGVAGGGVIISPNSNNTALLNAGYVKYGTLSQEGQGWQQMAQAPIVARRGHAAVWTGSRMLIWGGLQNNTSTLLADGARFDPATNTWESMSIGNAPSERSGFVTVWTGSEMIVWSGLGTGNTYLNTGARYNPATNTWTAMTTTGAPDARARASAIWTGTEMIVWGGSNSSGSFNTGGRYNPSTNTWTAITTTGAPAARSTHSAVWTGTRMLIWGSNLSAAGGRYNPATNTWETMSTLGAPEPGSGKTILWTGSTMVVWGGFSGESTNLGSRYNPNTDTWAAITTTGAPTARHSPSAVWTGTEVIIWGGRQGSGGNFNDGGRYNPITNTWIPISGAAAPEKKAAASAVWTGTDMLLFGGESDMGASMPFFYFADRFTPPTPLYLYLRP